MSESDFKEAVRMSIESRGIRATCKIFKSELEEERAYLDEVLGYVKNGDGQRLETSAISGLVKHYYKRDLADVTTPQGVGAKLRYAREIMDPKDLAAFEEAAKTRRSELAGKRRRKRTRK